ncbi:twin-arginine translocase TatA/TatE family subunit [Streptomyces sp. MJP52]|uniref:twin-arginine translocase TatA/TatE family subunit n=1 Tax=Streptomyces sp. MJP52 TaxID=2940555 RepID=UPI002476C011|nr:twin-arginine translocase TatA/TatE family subunit [Streptomyces sp. MJP52]MDH6225817.1 sec-independent protein translocase protein TatA [Streptomyces sp. MJP52]
MLGLSELAVVLIVVIVLLCARRLPGLARSAGRSARILKAEARAMKEERRKEARAEPRPAETAPSSPPRIVRGEVLPPASDRTGEPGRGTAPPR